MICKQVKTNPLLRIIPGVVRYFKKSILNSFHKILKDFKAVWGQHYDWEILHGTQFFIFFLHPHSINHSNKEGECNCRIFSF